MIDIKKEYETVDGDRVELITSSGRGKYPVLGYINDEEELTGWYFDGSTTTEDFTSWKDLVEVAS